MAFEWNNTTVIVAALSIAVSSIMSWRLKKNDEFATRMKQLNAATRLTREHGVKLDNFMYFESAPERLKTFLLEASDALEDQSVVMDLIRSPRGHRATDDDRVSETIRELQELRRNDPDASDVFEECLSTGIMAAFLRWPESAAVFAMGAADIEVSAKREIAFASQARYMKNNRSNEFIPEYDHALV